MKRPIFFILIGLIIGAILGLIASAKDVVCGENPPIRTCDERAYLNFNQPVPAPPMPGLSGSWREFVGPRPLNAALPESGRAAITYEQWTKETMRRRGE